MNQMYKVASSVAVLSALTLMGCSSDGGDEAGSKTTSTMVTTTTTDLFARSATPLPVPGEPRVSEVVVTVDGTDTVIAPDEVRCRIDDDARDTGFRHLIAKTGGQPPLIEVSKDGGYAIKVVLGEDGGTYEAGDEERFVASEAKVRIGASGGDYFVQFEDTVLGDATAKGVVFCTDFDD